MDVARILLRKKRSDNKSPILREALILIKEGELERGKSLLHEAGKGGESNAYIVLGKITNDENYFKEAMNLGNPVGSYYLGEQALEAGNYSVAKEYLERAYELGISQSYGILEKIETRKDWDYLWYVTFGPLFLLKRKEYLASFWQIILFAILSFISIKSITVTSFFMTYFFINLIFSNSYYRSIS